MTSSMDLTEREGRREGEGKARDGGQESERDRQRTKDAFACQPTAGRPSETDHDPYRATEPEGERDHHLVNLTLRHLVTFRGRGLLTPSLGTPLAHPRTSLRPRPPIDRQADRQTDRQTDRLDHSSVQIKSR